MTQARYYGISTGDGNNGVSHMFPDYIVKTSEPWRLIELAALTCFKPAALEWARENMMIDGEPEYTLSATFLESPEAQEEYSKAQEAYESGESDENPEHWDSDSAWLIIEAFPWEGETERPTYESLEEAFGEDINLVKPETA